MKDNTQPEPSGSPVHEWNNDEEAVPGMTCGDVSRFMSAYITSFRLFSESKRIGGIPGMTKELEKLLRLQRQAVAAIPDEASRAKATESMVFTTAAAGIAIMSAMKPDIPPVVYQELGDTAMGVAIKIAEENAKEFQSGSIRFGVRKVDDKPNGFEIGTHMMTQDSILEAVKDMGLSEMVQKLRDTQDKTLQGDN